MAKPTLDEFLDNNVEGYLIHDIKALMTIEAEKGKPAGACGYPLLMTVFSGIELLGTLSYGAIPFTGAAKDGFEFFKHYWTEYLYDASRAQEADSVYRLVRNGLAHAFFTKGPVWVTKHEDDTGAIPKEALLNTDTGKVVFNARLLANEFCGSYEQEFKPRVPQLRVTMEAQLQRMWDRYNAEAFGGGTRQPKMDYFKGRPSVPEVVFIQAGRSVSAAEVIVVHHISSTKGW
jgi:hypothetical protein